MMRLKAETIDMETSVPIVIMNEEDARELGVNPMDRIVVEKGSQKFTGIIDTTKHLVQEGKLGLTSNLDHLEGEVEVSITSKPESVKSIKKKLDGMELNKKEIEDVVKDINKNMLSDIELGSWVTGVYSIGMNMEETKFLTKAMVDVGERLNWNHEPIADKHSIGGVPGNRVTPIMIPIIAAAGVKIPKTSSRAITSPSGTADTMEVFCSVEFSLEHIKEIVHQTNACMVWGGAVNLSPTDDKIIRAENPLSLDPEAQVLASVLSKKKSAGSTHVVVDIPYGRNSKVEDIERAESLGRKFKDLGNELGMKVECAITRGDQPIGRGIGPKLEAIDILRVLKGQGPDDLRIKAIRSSNILLGLCGKEENAQHILASGKALEKFWSIIKAQGGKRIGEEDIELGEYRREIQAGREGNIASINNKSIAEIARRAGAPKDKGAGLYLNKKRGSFVESGDTLLTTYSENKDKLKNALEAYKDEKPFRIMEKGEMLMEEI